MEIDYNDPATIEKWVDRFVNASPYALHDFGDAAGCPTVRVNPGYNGLCQGQVTQWTWTQYDVWYVSARGSSEALPLIYSVHGTAALEWYGLSAYSYVNQGFSMPIYGSVTQLQACLDGRSQCSGRDNPPGTGFTQLRSVLDSDPDTAHDPIWSTDFRHHSDMP
jgi:hypothetical protein